MSALLTPVTAESMLGGEEEGGGGSSDVLPLHLLDSMDAEAVERLYGLLAHSAALVPCPAAARLARPAQPRPRPAESRAGTALPSLTLTLTLTLALTRPRPRLRPRTLSQP